MPSSCAQNWKWIIFIYSSWSQTRVLFVQHTFLCILNESLLIQNFHSTQLLFGGESLSTRWHPRRHGSRRQEKCLPMHHTHEDKSRSVSCLSIFAIHCTLFEIFSIEMYKKCVLYSEFIHGINFLHVTFIPLADDPTYPYLRTLLQFDTREFLNVLALVSVEEHFYRNHYLKFVNNTVL